MVSQPQCPRCNQNNPPQSSFCLACGVPLSVVCSNCGADLPISAQFCNRCGRSVDATVHSRLRTPEGYTPKHLIEKIIHSKSALEGERKQVTVLFADLKGSLALIADRDPEVARSLLDPVLERMIEAVHYYEGTVNQVMGDGIMALFGAPLALEDHAIRACHAALKMLELVGQYSDLSLQTHGVPVSIRVGLNSGDVVVRAIRSDLHMDYTAIGQTTHLAARMEQIARPGAALASAETFKLIQGYFKCKPLGSVPIAGMSAPVEVFELLEVGEARSRLEASAARGITRFVGRETEVAQLRQSLTHARAGRGQVVAAVGEPGVGKSRLFYEFVRSEECRGCLILETSGNAYGSVAPYLAVIQLLRKYFAIEERDGRRRQSEKVTEKILGGSPRLQVALPRPPLVDGSPGG